VLGKYLLRSARRQAQAHRQHADGPATHVLRWLDQREPQQPVHILQRHTLPSRRSPRLVQQSLDALREKPFPSAPYGLIGAPRLTRGLAKPVPAASPRMIHARHTCFCAVFGCFVMCSRLSQPSFVSTIFLNLLSVISCPLLTRLVAAQF